MSESTWDRDLLDAIWQERMTLCYKMLLIREMIEGADAEGEIEQELLARRFQDFFDNGKPMAKWKTTPTVSDLEPNLSDRSLEE